MLTVAQGGKSRSEAVSGDGVIYNIEPLKAGSFSFGDKTYKIVPEGGVRMIYTPSVWNVRDLGGWACTGGHIKYGKIFRGGHFGNITAADKTTLVDWLGIETDIDLRNNSETGSIQLHRHLATELNTSTSHWITTPVPSTPAMHPHVQWRF